MKKYLISLLILVFAVSMVLMGVGYKEEAAPAEEAAEEAAPAEEAAEEAAPAEEAAEKEDVHLLWWNWGEEESAGWDDYSQETADLYMEEHPNVTIEIVPQTQANLYEAFGAALAAGEGADIQNGWDGIWSMMWLWEDGMTPMSDYLTQEEMDRILFKEQFWADGKMWAMPLYFVSATFMYNKEIFREVGLDPDNPPADWDEFLDACETLKNAGYTPIQGGNLEGFVGLDVTSFFLDMNANKRTDFMEPYVNPDIDYADSKYSEGWYKLRELVDAGYFNEDINSTRYYQGWERFFSGETPMVEIMSGWAREVLDQLGGDDNVGVFPYFPVSGSGKYSTMFNAGTQDLWITPWSEHKEEAADFIKYLVSPERTQRMYELSHTFPANADFDPSVIETELEKDIFNHMKNNGKPMYSGFVPGFIVEEGLLTLTQEIFMPEVDLDETIEKFKALIPQVETMTPDGYEGFKAWYESYLEIGE